MKETRVATQWVQIHFEAAFLFLRIWAIHEISIIMIKMSGVITHIIQINYSFNVMYEVIILIVSSFMAFIEIRMPVGNNSNLKVS